MAPPRVQPTERVRQVIRILREAGARELANRLRMRAIDRLVGDSRPFLPVSADDLGRAAELLAGERSLPSAVPARDDGSPMRVDWITLPVLEPSGGNAVMFRLISAFEAAGHACRIIIQDHARRPIAVHERAIRAGWPGIHADVRDLADGLGDADALFATSWPTAYPLLASDARGTRCYLVADYEPMFYPAGSDALLAEATYRFGFHGVTLGSWLSSLLSTRFGMAAQCFDFGYDISHYRLDPDVDRAFGQVRICHYCRPSTPRRAHELAMLVLTLFATRNPNVAIDIFGSPARRRPFASVEHGILSPDALGALYNRSAAGLVLSATNASLVPLEMLAAGCVPVVNDAEHNRIVLDNPNVAYASPSPMALALRLEEIVRRTASERAAVARTAAASVQGRSWDVAGDQALAITRAAVLAARAPE